MEQHEKNKKAIVGIILTITAMIIGLIVTSYMNPHSSSHKVFGVTYMTMNNPFYEVINNEIEKVVDENGDRLMTLDPALDVEKQNQQIYSFIHQRVDGIFVNPIDSQKIKPAIEAAKKANIPVIVVDAPVLDEELVNCTIVSDNYDAGVQCAKDMMKRMDHANIILLKHTTVKSAKDRIDGFLDTIQFHSQYQVVNEGECEGQLELAMPMMEKMLKETNQVDVVMALNDPSALGALAALEAQDKDNVIVYGIDGTPDLKSLIRQSEMVAGTVAQSPISLGKIAVEKMYQVLNGEDIESQIKIPVTLIHNDNISRYDEKGWQ